MLVAYELGKSIGEVTELGQDEIGYWLAFFKYKGELEEKAAKARQAKRTTVNRR